MTEDKPHQKFSPDDILRVFRDKAVVPFDPIPYKVEKVPMEEFRERMCSFCPRQDPEGFLAGLADLPSFPMIPMERGESLDEALRHADEDDAVFLEAFRSSEDS